MPDPAAERYAQASVLFSGGTDSALAAVEMLRRCDQVTLLTFDPGYIFFVENSRVHAEALARKYGEDRVRHLILPISDVVRSVLFSDVKKDLAAYGFDMTALVCMGCRLSMHTAAIIFNLENGIPVLADGSIEKQSAIPEQRQAVIEANRERYLEQYGILHLSPIYTERHSDEKLFAEGIASKQRLKKQFIFFDTQATCVFGVPADVYARMFYKPIMGKSTDIQSVAYCQQRYPLMHNVIERHLAGKGLDLGALVARLKGMHATAPGRAS